jgi:formylglycine-generating enzyme required for sulfatase activity
MPMTFNQRQLLKDAGPKEVSMTVWPGARRQKRGIAYGVAVLIVLATAHTFLSAQEPAKPAAPKKEIAIDLGGVKLELVRVEPGEFVMGAPQEEPRAGDFDKPQRRVKTTKPFYLGRYEVTRAQFAAFVKGSGYTTEHEQAGRERTWRRTGFAQFDDHPVVYVTWNDAKAFCAWLAKQSNAKTFGLKHAGLPSEAQWEYACRAGTTTRYYSGDNADDLKGFANLADAEYRRVHKFGGPQTVAWDDGFAFTAPVGKFKPNAFGLYDMHGNVQEWCEDFFGPYGDLPTTDPLRTESHPKFKGEHAYRGGGHYSDAASCAAFVRSWARAEGAFKDAAADIGFRVCITLD